MSNHAYVDMDWGKR